MTSTTTAPAPTVSCVYCDGGTVYAGVYAPRRQCMICKGSGRIAPTTCATCAEPLLDGQAKRWWGKDTFHKDC